MFIFGVVRGAGGGGLARSWMWVGFLEIRIRFKGEIVSIYSVFFWILSTGLTDFVSIQLCLWDVIPANCVDVVMHFKCKLIDFYECARKPCPQDCSSATMRRKNYYILGQVKQYISLSSPPTSFFAAASFFSFFLCLKVWFATKNFDPPCCAYHLRRSMREIMALFNCLCI